MGRAHTRVEAAHRATAERVRTAAAALRADPEVLDDPARAAEVRAATAALLEVAADPTHTRGLAQELWDRLAHLADRVIARPLSDSLPEAQPMPDGYNNGTGTQEVAR